MNNLSDLHFVDNPVIRGQDGRYTTITVNVPAVLKSWRISLFSYEWILPDGRIKDLAELPPAEQAKRRAAEDILGGNDPVEKPILGIGLLENVEIGSGKALFLTLAAHGCQTLPVHIPRSNTKEFEPFRA
jgi:hypothetical protein